MGLSLRMLSRLFVLAAAVTFAGGIAARAQFNPYATFSAAHYSGQGVGIGTAPTQSGGITALGGTFGSFGYFQGVRGPIGVGPDVRLVIANSANSTVNGNKVIAGFVGLRLAADGAHLPVVPYIQFEVGGAGTNNGTQTYKTGSFAYQVQFGADIPTAIPQLSGRVEYGAGQLTGINYTNHTLQTFSAGIVLRFDNPVRRRY